MITLFALPKPFWGHIDTIQRNAVQSWMRLHPDVEIVLFGDDDGTADIAHEFRLRHEPEVERNDHGTVLVNALFRRAEQVASNGILAYVNADIMLLPDFIEAVRSVRFRRFLIVGRRWNVAIDEAWDFADPGWDGRLCSYVRAHGTPAEITAIDYFVFTRGLWGDSIPPFALGRTTWDNWLIYGARRAGARIVDATAAVTAVHQNHDYAHLPGGKVEAWEGTEAQRNRALSGDAGQVHTLADAGWLLQHGRVVPNLSVAHLARRLEHLRFSHAGLTSAIALPLKWLGVADYPIRLLHRLQNGVRNDRRSP